MKELIEIQNELKVPKNQFNKFGNYNYRNCEDILEAVKPLSKKYNCLLTLSDEIIERNGRFYVESTARLTNADNVEIIVKASAREEETKKGMDSSQITGSASSYARKYALNGLFCIDDSKDADNFPAEEKSREEILSMKRKSVYDVMLRNNDALITVLNRYSIGQMEDLTEKQIEQQYDAWKKKGVIQ